MSGQKRKADDDAINGPAEKKAKVVTAATDRVPAATAQRASPDASITHTRPTTPKPIDTVMEVDEQEPVLESEKKKGKRKASTAQSDVDTTIKAVKYRKLAPPRPFPTVPTSVSATGPRSAHVEGKNYICITRKTPLGAYLRRCKDVVLKAGCVSKPIGRLHEY
jgi:ribonuclease P/MRP protein subunit RPP20